MTGERVIIEYEGQRYPFDFADITVKQAIRMEKFTGMSFGEWGKAVAAGSSLVAVQAVGWLVLHGGDLAVPIEDCDFKLARLSEAIKVANAAEEAAEVAAAKAAEAVGPRPTGGTSTPPKVIANGAGDLSPESLTAGP
jgi:hypothetical protein